MEQKHKSIADHNARMLNIFTVFQGTIFILPVLLPYYREQLGLGFWELMVGEAFFSAVILFCEVPTGWLADHWKRKYVLALSGVAGIAGFGLILIADGFLTSVIGQGTLGLSVSLVSGTLSALHYDSLLAENRVGEYRRQEGRRHGLGLLAVGFSSLLGGFLYEADPTWPLIGTILSEFGMIAAALWMIEPDRVRIVQSRGPFATMAETMKYALHGHREVAEIIFSAAALFGTTKMLMWAQQPYYISIHLDEKWYGVMMAGGFLLGALASQIGHLLDRRLRNRTVLFVMTLAVIIICVTSAALHSIWGAALLLSGSWFWGLGWPRVQAALNDCTDSSRRATVLSTCSLMIHLVFIPLSLMIGRVSDLYGAQTAVLTLCVIPGLAALSLLRIVLRETRAAKVLIH